jgi:hypothetical protein
MKGPKQFTRFCVWGVLCLARFGHQHLFQPVADYAIDTCTAAWEESLKSIVRETLTAVVRTISSVSAAIVSLFYQKGYYKSLRSQFKATDAWQHYWTENHQSTLNAVVERETYVSSARLALLGCCL